MIRLAILDAVPSAYVHMDDNLNNGAKFVDLLNDVNIDAEMTIYNVSDGIFPPSVQTYDAYLVTGSPSSVFDDDLWIKQLLDFIRKAHQLKKRMVGICFGHQAIAYALGGHVERSPDGWLLGLHQFDLLETPAWMQPVQSSCRIYHINQDQVMSLPPDAKHVGQSTACVNNMYTIGEHILGIQGHPEQQLQSMRNFINGLGDVLSADVVSKAEQSFRTAEPDRLVVAEWIRRFLTD